MGGKYSVKNLKEVIDLGFAIELARQQAGADGKYRLDDIPYLLPVIQKIGPAYADFRLLDDEFLELDDEDGKELLAYVGGKLPGLPSDKVKLIAVGILKVALGGAQIMAAFKDPEVVRALKNVTPK